MPIRHNNGVNSGSNPRPVNPQTSTAPKPAISADANKDSTTPVANSNNSDSFTAASVGHNSTSLNDSSSLSGNSIIDTVSSEIDGIANAVSLANGNAIVNTRVLASNWENQIPSTDISGLKINGLNLESVKNGEIVVRFPLRQGTFSIPTSHAAAETKIGGNGHVEVALRIGRNAEGQQIITTASIQFEPKLTVLNPASSLQPSDGFMGPLLDWVQDVAGDVQIGGLSVDKDGEVKIDGSIIRPWPLDDQDLGENIPQGTFPIINMGLQSIAEGQLVKVEAAAQSGQSPSLNALLSALGALTKAGDFSVQLHSRSTSLGIDAEGLHMRSEKSPVEIDIKGKVQLDDEGNLYFKVPKSPQAEIKSGAGELDLAGHINLRADPEGHILARGAVLSHGTMGHIEGELNYGDISDLPFVINSPDNVLIGKTVLNYDGDKVHVGRGRLQANLHASLGEGAQLSIKGSKIDLYGGELVSDSNLHFFTDEKGLSINDGVLDMQVSSTDASLHSGTTMINVDGSARVNVHGERLRLDAHTGSTQGRGQLKFRLSPKGFSNANTPFWGSVDYDLLPDGRLNLHPGPDGLTEFAAPFSAIAKVSSIVDPETAAVGRVGSAKLKAHLAKLCDSPLRTESHASLLINGPQSRSKRLQMIHAAKKSIVMQTLIFKDDITGKETAKALISAAKRGVKVRLIVDTVGNLQEPSELAEGKDLYQRLRAGGVELALYNDPRDTGLGKLLTVVIGNPELSQFQDINAMLNDPVQALDFMQNLSRIAAGEGQVSAKTRADISQAIDEILTKNSDNGLSVNSTDLSTVSRNNNAKVGELLTALRLAASLNNRWHEKYLVVDGEQAITGGRNIADEYLLGVNDGKIVRDGVARSPWRDTDIHFEGEAARDVLRDFAHNWKIVKGEDISVPATPPSHEDIAIDSDSVNNNNSLNTVPQMQIIQHHPRVDGDHHIINFMIENLKALEPGQKAYITNAYFLPTGALKAYKQALLDAAKRGVDVRILTNSERSTDLPQVNQAAYQSYLDLLNAGVRIFERKGERTMHTKAAVFGSNTGTVGSWNTDNRSASLNSEHLAVVYDPKFAKQLEDMFASDSAADVAKELSSTEVHARLIALGLKGSLTSLFADLM